MVELPESLSGEDESAAVLVRGAREQALTLLQPPLEEGMSEEGMMPFMRKLYRARNLVLDHVRNLSQRPASANSLSSPNPKANASSGT